MPKAGPPSEPVAPAPLSQAETAYIKMIVRRFYGDDAVVRNYGPDPQRLFLHVEASNAPGLERDECLGFLMCEVVRDYISLDVIKRGVRIRGNSKLAYRQGQVI